METISSVSVAFVEAVRVEEVLVMEEAHARAQHDRLLHRLAAIQRLKEIVNEVVSADCWTRYVHSTDLWFSFVTWSDTKNTIEKIALL